MKEFSTKAPGNALTRWWTTILGCSRRLRRSSHLPLEKGDHPELDDSEELEIDQDLPVPD
jgi:hypothetical protein